MKTYYDDCRQGEKPKYYTETELAYNYVFSNAEDLQAWKEVMRLAGLETNSGSYNKIKDLSLIHI